MAKTYEIPYDAQNRTWTPTPINVRLLRRNPASGAYDPCGFGTPVFRTDQPDLLSFDVRAQDKFFTAYTAPSRAFLDLPGDDKFGRPITVTIEAESPEADPVTGQPRKLTSTCTVTVAPPQVKMGYLVKPAEFLKEGVVQVPADGKSALTLSVWVEQEEGGQVYRAPDDDYTFQFACNLAEDDFRCLNAKEATLPPDSRWKSLRYLSDLPEPRAGVIAVDAWSNRRQAQKPAGQLQIPVQLVSPKTKAEVQFSPPLPAIPRTDVTVTVRLTNESTGDPVANTPATVIWGKDSESGPLGSLPRPATATDADGTLTFTYTPPDALEYAKGKRLYDEVNLVIGEGESKVKLDRRIFLPVAPQITMFLEGEKKGLLAKADEQPITVPPEQVKGWTLQGLVMLPAEVPEAEKKYFGVFDAEMKVAFEKPDNPPVRFKTALKGKYSLVLDELRTAFGKARLEDGKITLDPDPAHDQVALVKLDTEADEAISGYESECSSGAVNFELFNEGFARKLKQYRFEFCRQLAEQPKDRYNLAIAGLRLLLVALKGSKTYFNRFKPHEDKTKDAFTTMIGTLVNILTTVIDFSGKLKDLGEWAIGKGVAAFKWLAESKFGKWLAGGASFLGGKIAAIGTQAKNVILPYLDSLWSGLKNLLGKLGELGRKAIAALEPVITPFIKLAYGLAAKLEAAIDGFLAALSGISEHWDDFVTWIKGTKVEVTDAPPWAASLWNGLKGVIDGLVQFVGHLCKGLGQAIYTVVSGAFSLMVKLASRLFKPMLDSFAEFAGDVRKKVVDLFKDDWKRIVAEAEEDDSTWDDIGISKLIDNLVAGPLIDFFMNHPITEEIHSLNQQDARMTLDLLGRHPQKVVGFVYSSACAQSVPANWEEKRTRFTRAISEMNMQYHTYDQFTNTLSEVLELANIVISTAGLAVALLGIVFSGGALAASAPLANTLMGNIDKAFIVFKAMVSDLPQLAGAIVVMFILVLRYDHLVTELVLGGSSGGGEGAAA